jgi:hypothetical protein
LKHSDNGKKKESKMKPSWNGKKGKKRKTEKYLTWNQLRMERNNYEKQVFKTIVI